MKLILLVTVMIPFVTCLSARELQPQTAKVKGRIIQNVSGDAVVDAVIALPHLKLLTVTDSNGIFQFPEVIYGSHVLLVHRGNRAVDTFRILIDLKEVELGDLYASALADTNDIAENEMTVLLQEEGLSALKGEDIQNRDIPTLLSFSRDPYLSVASFNLAALGFRLRGYNGDQQEVYINSLPVNDVETGNALYGQWAGLSDMFMDANLTYGLQQAEEGLGGAAGVLSISLSAADRPAQTRIAYAHGNRTFRNRFQISHHTGMLTNGWALSLSASYRLAREGYVEGTFYEGYSWFLGLSKKLGKKGMLHVTTFAAPARTGLASAATEEALVLSGSNFYNPNWGYLNEVKRNARETQSFQPVVLLNYEYRPATQTLLNIVAAYQSGSQGLSSLDWYNAPDPRPDYYQYLPGYWVQHQEVPRPEIAEAYRNQWQSDISTRQINWHHLYERNATCDETFNGVSGIRSAYILGEDREDTKVYRVALNLKKSIGEHIRVYGGFSFIMQQTENYRKLLDLLGGDYYADLNQFAERNYPDHAAFRQPDLNQSDHVVREGDRYAYNYISRFRKARGWLQTTGSFRKLDLFAGIRIGWDEFGREGLYRNGLFPDDSYGSSKMQSFNTWQLKGGITYKVNGHHYLFMNASVATRPPIFDHTFYSPRTRNAIVAKPVPEYTRAFEGGYTLNSPWIKGRATGFYTDRQDVAQILRFYYEDYSSFVNYVMRGIHIQHMGAELALQAQLHSSFTATVMATWMQVVYKSRPEVSIYPDNDTAVEMGNSKVYMKDYFVATGPQSVYALAFHYRPERQSFTAVNFNLLDRNYVNMNPARLTEEAVSLLEPDSDLWNKIREQGKLPKAFSIDVSAGKSFGLKRFIKGLNGNPLLLINVGINNILNNKNAVLSRSQQLRFDYESRNPELFPDKYRYALGTTYFIGVQLRF